MMPRLLLLALLLLLITSSTVNGRVKRSHFCPSCGSNHHHHHEADDQDTVAINAVAVAGETARLESVKRQILIKLGLEAKPDVSALGTAGRLPPREVVLETLLRAEESVDESTILSAPPSPASTTTTTTNRRRHQHSTDDSSSSSGGGLHDDDFYGKTSEIIAFAEPGPRWNGQVLVEFSSRQRASSSSEVVEPGLRVKAATLWLYVHVEQQQQQRNHHRRFSLHLLQQQQQPRPPTLYIFRVLTVPTTPNGIGNNNSSLDSWSELVASQRVTLQHSGWMKVNVTEGVRKWFSSTSTKLRLLVDCSGCASGQAEPVLFSSRRRRRRLRKRRKRRRRQTSVVEEDVVSGGGGGSNDDDRHRPFLVIHTESVSSRRLRRRTPLDCSASLGQQQQCCKQRFYVSFRALGWDDWIIAPSGYYANYCRGGCGTALTRTPDTFSSYHTHVIDQVLKVGSPSAADQHLSAAMQQPCCAPTKFSSMSLIYFGPDMNIIKRDLPKMVVDECACP